MRSAVHSARGVDAPGDFGGRACARPGSAWRLATLLFGNGDRHVTAEMLHEEAVQAGERVSLATVYNTLHQFKRAGLLREIAIGGQRAYFDTNTSNHNHFFVEAEGRLIDIPGNFDPRRRPAGAAGRTSRSPTSTWWCGWSASSGCLRERAGRRAT